ncbi:MAG TPA: hypothetical protein PKX28_05810, partial [Candidatus Hydrogenedentes bacterium]|nr:hypothetical protein [Candidatus Hydrogenedentota bacterium]
TGEVIEAFIEKQAEEEWPNPVTRSNMITAMRRLGMFCNYYLQYYYSTDSVLETLKNKPKTRGEEVVEVEQALFRKYQDPGLTEKPEELGKRGGAHYSTAAFMLIEAVENDLRNRQIVCVRNGGAVPTLDADASVEIPALIGRDGAIPIPQPAPEPVIRGLMQNIKAYETLTVLAAVTGDREAAFEAMLLHPLMPGADGCVKLLDELLEINRPYLQGTFF